MNQDAEHLRLLSIFYYISAALTGLFSCFPIFYGIFGIAMLGGSAGRSGKGETAMVGGIFLVIGIVIFLLLLVIAGLTAYVGKSLSERKNYTFCLVMAAISCLSFPIGTALGVFTFIVLFRPSVKEMFGQSPPQRA